MVVEGRDNLWPAPKFHFAVRWGDAGRGDTELRFQEVSGLDTDAQVLDYRAGNSPVFSAIRRPGMIKPGNVTMKKAVFARDHAIWDWFREAEMNRITRRDVTVALVDESDAPTMEWRLKNAFPVKISGTDLKAEGNEIAVEIVELAHEGISVEMG